MIAKDQIAAELRALYEQHHGLNPEVVVAWAQSNPDSALHSRFEWDDGEAAHQYRLSQARTVITEVTVIYPDRRERQVYVSPIECRGTVGYVPLVEVMSDEAMRQRYLSQVLAEYERLGRKYADLAELAGIREAVKRTVDDVRARHRARKEQVA